MPRAEAAPGPVSYKANQTLFTSAEADVLRHLRRQIGRAGHVCPCVRVADVLKVEANGDRSAWQRAFNQIAKKHIGFVVTSPNGSILFAVEVDDSSHRAPKRQARDAHLNEVFKLAGVRLIRFAPGEAATSRDLAHAIESVRADPAEAA